MIEKIKKWDTRYINKKSRGNLDRMEIFFETESGKYYGVALYDVATQLENKFNKFQEIVINHEPVEIQGEKHLVFGSCVFGYKKH